METGNDGMNREPRLKFPLWQYLTQPLFSPEFKSLNPLRFWKLHNLDQLEQAWGRSAMPQSLPEENLLEFLENCWGQRCSKTEPAQGIDKLRYVRLLERCWQQPIEPPQHPSDESGEYFDESEECR